MSFVFIFDGIFSGFFAADAPTSIFLDFPGASPVSSAAALVDDDASFLGAGVLGLSRCAVPLNAGGSDFSDSIRRPEPLKGIGAGASLDSRARPMLRPLVGLGATTTSMGGVIGFDFPLILFVGLVSAGGTVVVSAAALDELDAAPGARDALLLLALACAVGAAASRFGTEAARGGATLSGNGAGFSFGAEFAFASRAAFRLVSSVALIFALSAFANLLLILLSTAAALSDFLILPLPGGGGGPPGGGAIPAGVSGGPGCMCITNSLGLVFPFTRHPFVVFWPFCVFTAFPPTEIVVAPEPGGPGGG
jgi:hypothetical protein